MSHPGDRDDGASPLVHDYIRPAGRVPPEPSTVPLWLIGAAFLALAVWAMPDLVAWISSWGICR